jgi:hypothetical protein
MPDIGHSLHRVRPAAHGLGGKGAVFGSPPLFSGYFQVIGNLLPTRAFGKSLPPGPAMVRAGRGSVARPGRGTSPLYRHSKKGLTRGVGRN